MEKDIITILKIINANLVTKPAKLAMMVLAKNNARLATQINFSIISNVLMIALTISAQQTINLVKPAPTHLHAALKSHHQIGNAERHIKANLFVALMEMALNRL